MRERLATVRILGKDDMTSVEKRLAQILGGKEDAKCTLLRSEDFIKLRLCALYDIGKAPLSVYHENVQVHLGENKTISIFLLCTEYLSEDDDSNALSGRKREYDSSNSDIE